MSKAIQYLEKLAAKKEKEKERGIGLSGAIGAPLLAAGVLGLAGSVPATKMLLRGARAPESKSLLSKLMPKSYDARDFVADYIATSHGVGHTPYAKPLRAYAKTQAKPSLTYPTLEQAEKEMMDHYDSFLSKDPKDAVRKWIDEVIAHKKENFLKKDPTFKGNRVTQEFEERGQKLKDYIAQPHEDTLKLIREIEDPELLKMLINMQAQKAGVSGFYGKLGLGGLGLAGVGAGLVGKEIYDQSQKE
jgi:hypothetical protein